MNAPTLTMSLILITRNRRDELYQTLLSVNAQRAEFELIVVDNGSEDATLAMIREVCPEAVVVELSSNQGVGGGRNRGIEAATGDILVFLDDDASFADPEALCLEGAVRHTSSTLEYLDRLIQDVAKVIADPPFFATRCQFMSQVSSVSFLISVYTLEQGNGSVLSGNVKAQTYGLDKGRTATPNTVHIRAMGSRQFSSPVNG